MHGRLLIVIVRFINLYPRREPILNPGGSVRAADGQAGEGIILSGLVLSQLTVLKFQEKTKSQVLRIRTYFGGSDLKVWWQNATLLVYFSYFITDIHSFNHIHTFIRRLSLKPPSIFSSLVCSVRKTSLWCRAENRLTASRRAAN